MDKDKIDELRDMVGEMLAKSRAHGQDPGKSPPLAPNIQAMKLREVLNDRLRPNPFKRGDLVVQIDALRNYTYPGPGEVAIVTEVAAPSKDFHEVTEHRGDAYRREDIIILCLCKSSDEKRGHYVQFAAESWRFEVYTGPVGLDDSKA